MSYRDELRRVIEAAGVRVVGDRGNLRLSFGTFPVFELQADDNAHALRLIDALASFYSADAEVADLAHRLAGRVREPLALAQRIQEWIQNNVVFIPERRERFQHPIFTLYAGGDCDDHAILVEALLAALGVPARAEPIYDNDGSIVHTADRVYVGGAWRWAETTVAAHWDESPRDAALRLGVARPDILG
jgi:transglutaminase-like putative cysteine protease